LQQAFIVLGFSCSRPLMQQAFIALGFSCSRPLLIAVAICQQCLLFVCCNKENNEREKEQRGATTLSRTAGKSKWPTFIMFSQ
jgi:hypothetical protein